ncbi:MAG: hypothetical protein ACMVP2_01710 [Imperialibacter sp.]|uniref:hypothetical protein n=1 Tax=Imperialibacter sp. TaxID=2038411 RepID=UPI003A8A082E
MSEKEIKELVKKALDDGLSILRYQEERVEQEEIADPFSFYEQFPFLQWSKNGLPDFSYSSVAKIRYSNLFLKGNRYNDIQSWKTLQQGLLNNKDYVTFYGLTAEEEVARNYHTYFFIADLIDHYAHVYGKLEYHEKAFEPVFQAWYGAWSKNELKVDVWVPILFLHFPVGEVELGPGLALRQIDDARQLSKAYFGRHLNSKLQQVFASATHALVFEDWVVDNTSLEARNDFLNDPNAFSDIIEHLAYLMGSLRVVTGEETGYGQLLVCPAGWSDQWAADLLPCFPIEQHDFPASFLNQKWKQTPPKIKEKDIQDIADIYKSLSKGGRKSLEVGVQKLNSIYLNDQSPESMIDILTALEALLLDEVHGDPVYKLSMRLGSLLQIAPFSRKEANDIFKVVEALYKYKLSILKGSSHLNGKERKISFYPKKKIDVVSFGTDLLRHILLTFFKNPQMQEPAYLDRMLINRG